MWHLFSAGLCCDWGWGTVVKVSALTGEGDAIVAEAVSLNFKHLSAENEDPASSLGRVTDWGPESHLPQFPPSNLLKIQLRGSHLRPSDSKSLEAASRNWRSPSQAMLMHLPISGPRFTF